MPPSGKEPIVMVWPSDHYAFKSSSLTWSGSIVAGW
jgi:hypothetical protein